VIYIFGLICCVLTNGALEVLVPGLRLGDVRESQLEVLRAEDVVMRPVDGEVHLRGASDQSGVLCLS